MSLFFSSGECVAHSFFFFGNRREDRTIARAFSKLYGFGGRDKKISKGVYSQPFEFILPASLPSSTQYPKLDGKNFHCRIHYRLRAEIGDLYYDQVFYVVSAPLANNIVPCITHPTTYDLKQAKVLSKGYLSIGACVENSFVGRSQEMKVSVACRNDSSVNVDRVRIKLVELIECKAQDEKNTFKNELVEIRDINLPGLVKCRSKDTVRMNKKRFSQTKESTYQHILHDLTSGQNQFQLTIPENARDTYHGDLISISHYLKITYYTKLSVENAETKIPIVIGSPRANPGYHVLERAANEPIATIVAGDPLELDISPLCNESTVEVGYDLPPMVDALVLPSPRQSPGTVLPMDRNVAIGEARIRSYSSDVEDDCNDNPEFLRSSTPVPSAPDESLLMQERWTVEPTEIHGHPASLTSTLDQLHASTPSAYAPYAVYNNPVREFNSSCPGLSAADSSAESTYHQENMRSRIDSYAYDEMTDVSALTEPFDGPQLGLAAQFRTPERFNEVATSQQLLDRLLRELRASIHDYEVIFSKTRRSEYRKLYSSLSPKDLGQIVANVSMPYQVQVAVLLARYMVMYKSSFTCAHCAEAVKNSSSYFRTNMAETLLPYCHDVERNRNLVELELSDWERCVIHRTFEDLS